MAAASGRIAPRRQALSHPSAALPDLRSRLHGRGGALGCAFALRLCDDHRREPLRRARHPAALWLHFPRRLCLCKAEEGIYLCSGRLKPAVLRGRRAAAHAGQRPGALSGGLRLLRRRRVLFRRVPRYHRQCGRARGIFQPMHTAVHRRAGYERRAARSAPVHPRCGLSCDTARLRRRLGRSGARIRRSGRRAVPRLGAGKEAS